MEEEDEERDNGMKINNRGLVSHYPVFFHGSPSPRGQPYMILLYFIKVFEIQRIAWWNAVPIKHSCYMYTNSKVE